MLTNAPFHWALLAFLVSFASPPLNWIWKICDFAVLTIGALSGPFCLVIWPLLLLFWLMRRERWSLINLAILSPFLAIQAAKLIFGGISSRAPGDLGATPMLFLRLLAGHVYVGSIWGENGFAVHAAPVAVLIVTALGTAVLIYAVCNGPLELHFLIAFSMILFVAALSKPLIAGPSPQWQLLAIDPGARYWFFPMLALLWSLGFCASQKQSKPSRILSYLAFVAMLHGVMHDRRYPPSSDKEFREFLKAFESAPVGSWVTVPNGDGLPYLKKHGQE